MCFLKAHSFSLGGLWTHNSCLVTVSAHVVFVAHECRQLGKFMSYDNLLYCDVHALEKSLFGNYWHFSIYNVK